MTFSNSIGNTGNVGKQNNVRFGANKPAGKVEQPKVPVSFTTDNQREITRESLDMLNPYGCMGLEIKHKTPEARLADAANKDFGSWNNYYAIEDTDFAVAELGNIVKTLDNVMLAKKTLSPERQEQVIAGFSDRNPSPNAFTGEFLDVFTA